MKHKSSGETADIGRAVADRAGDGIIVVKDGILKFVNPSFAALVGYEAVELPGVEFSMMLTSMSLGVFTQRGEGRMWGQDQPSIYQLDLLTRDSEVRPVEVRSSVMEIDGEIADVLILREIDHCRQSSEMSSNSLLDGCLAGMYIIRDGRFQLVNTRLEQDLGYDRDELLQIKPLELVHPEDRRKVREDVMRMIRGQQKTEYEFRAVARNGAVKHMLGKVSLIAFQGKRAMLGSYVDVTDHKTVEIALASAAAHYESIIGSVPEVLLIFNENDELIHFSQACEQFSGQDVAGCLGKSKWKTFEELSLLTSRSIEDIKDKVIDNLQTGEPLFGIEIEAFDSDGNRVPMLFSSQKIRDVSGKKIGDVVLINNMSPLKQLKDQLMDTVEKLKANQIEISTPVVQVWDRVLALPLIGVIDSHRAQSIMDILLSRIADTQSEMVIVDITGVSLVDTHVANHLIQTVEAANMLGTECIITGIKPEIAQTMIHLGLDVGSFPTRRNLRDGLLYALKKMGYEVQMAGYASAG